MNIDQGVQVADLVGVLRRRGKLMRQSIQDLAGQVGVADAEISAVKQQEDYVASVSFRYELDAFHF